MASTSSDRRQGVNPGAALKVPCKAATTANITLSGLQTIDGVSCVADDRVLVKDQTTTSENGIYVVSSSTWQRAKDWDGAFDVKKGTVVHITDGTTNSRTWWEVTTSDPITPGTTSVSFVQGLADAADVLFTQSGGSGATTTTVQAELRVVVRPEQFGSASTNLGLAIAAVAAAGGGDVLLGVGSYGPLGRTLTESNVRIIGKKCPDFKTDGTGLENGSIIKGPLIYTGNNLEFHNLGVDSGSAVCTALYSGTAQEGLVCSITQIGSYDAALRPQKTGLVINNVRCIAKDADSLVHAFACEGHTGASVTRLQTLFGYHGQAYKVWDSVITDLWARGSGAEGIVIKSDAWRTCKNSVFKGIRTSSYATNDSDNGIDIQAQGNTEVSDLVIDDAICTAHQFDGIRFSAATGGDLIRDITITNSHFNNNGADGSSSTGPRTRINFVGCSANDNGQFGFTDNASTSYTSYTACKAKGNSSGFVFFGTNIDIVANTANSNTNYGFYAKTGSSIYKLGNRGASNGTSLYGSDGATVLFKNRQTPDSVTAPTFSGTWVNYDASNNTQAGYYIDDEGTVHLQGLVKSGVAGTAIFTLPAGYRPAKFVRFPVTTLSGATVTLGEVHVSSAGVVTHAVGGTDYVSLDGIYFRTFGSS